MSPIRKCQHAICEKHLSKLHNINILEVGCGEKRKGYFVKEMVEGHNCKWTGIDINSTDLTSFVCSVEKMPFNDFTFDCVIGNQTIEHWDNIDTSLQEIYRVMKKGGFLYLTAPIHLHGRIEFIEGNFEEIEENFTRNNFHIFCCETWRKDYVPLYKYFPDTAKKNIKKNKININLDNTVSYICFFLLEKEQ
jgi:ubiquinone/menaquinone biosynthesis C-methylase UbiE